MQVFNISGTCFYKYVSNIKFSYDWVRLRPYSTSATLWPVLPVPDDDECGGFVGMSGMRS
jgi:hypothetical protein